MNYHRQTNSVVISYYYYYYYNYYYYYTVSQKKFPPSTCFNLDTHDLITIFFWQKCYWETMKSYGDLFSHLTYLVLRHYLRNRKPRRQRTGALYVQHSPTAAALSTSLSPEPRPQQSL